MSKKQAEINRLIRELKKLMNRNTFIYIEKGRAAIKNSAIK